MLFEVERPAAKVAPGVAHVPGYWSTPEQHAWVARFRDLARRASGTPFAMQRPQLASGGRMSVHMLNLGHYFDYDSYRYVDRKFGHTVPALPGDLRQAAIDAVSRAAALAGELAPWAESYLPDMALVNYYPPGAQMGMHQDRYESTRAPIVSFSIGEEALFRIGGTENRNRPWEEVTLASGDLIVFGGPKRFAFHGVPEVRPGTAPEGCGLAQGRINVTVRQVFSG